MYHDTLLKSVTGQLHAHGCPLPTPSPSYPLQGSKHACNDTCTELVRVQALFVMRLGVRSETARGCMHCSLLTRYYGKAASKCVVIYQLLEMQYVWHRTTLQGPSNCMPLPIIRIPRQQAHWSRSSASEKCILSGTRHHSPEPTLKPHATKEACSMALTIANLLCLHRHFGGSKKAASGYQGSTPTLPTVLQHQFGGPQEKQQAAFSEGQTPESPHYTRNLASQETSSG
eukprot:1160914-Pelagomonas_calceolata.AAC.20